MTEKKEPNENLIASHCSSFGIQGDSVVEQLLDACKKAEEMIGRIAIMEVNGEVGRLVDKLRSAISAAENASSKEILDNSNSQESLDSSLDWLKPGENEILKFYRSTPRGIDGLDEWDQVATVLGYLSRPSMSKDVDVEVATDALAELQPERREFWLRVGATYRDNFCRTLVEMLK